MDETTRVILERIEADIACIKKGLFHTKDGVTIRVDRLERSYMWVKGIVAAFSLAVLGVIANIIQALITGE